MVFADWSGGVSDGSIVKIYHAGEYDVQISLAAADQAVFRPRSCAVRPYQLTGQQFNGLSQAASFGDELETATNYPLVRITNIALDTFFLCPHPWT